MERKHIAILAKNTSSLKFLENFFRTRKAYRTSYFKKAETLLRHAQGDPPDAIISDVSLLPLISEKVTRFPRLAMISGEIKKGISTAVKHDVKYYLYKPYHSIDLEQKLGSLILERDTVEKANSDIRELEAIIDLIQSISSTLDPKELLQRIVRKIATNIPVSRCSMIRTDRLRRYAYVVATFENPLLTGIRLSLRKYPEILEAINSKKPVLIKDVATDPVMSRVRDTVTSLGIRSILVLPVVFNERVVGTLFLRTSRTEYTFTEHEIRMLGAMANASSTALHNALLFEQVEDEKSRLEKMAITDYLTGIYNIRYFYNRISEEFSRCQRYSLPISCLMADIDHFKRINDVFGHKTGDMVLKEFSQLLKKHSRKSDVLARYGGEEFIVLLPQTPLEGAVAEAKRILDSVSQYKFRSLKGKGGVTVSIGIASHPGTKVKTHDELISFSDQALFVAKNGGRNRVEVYKD